MHPEESTPFRLGGATLTNGQSYPSATGDKIDRMLKSWSAENTLRVTIGGVATFGAGSLQRQISFDNGTTWVNDGAAITVATPTIVELARSAKYRWTVAGADITVATLYLA